MVAAGPAGIESLILSDPLQRQQHLHKFSRCGLELLQRQQACCNYSRFEKFAKAANFSSDCDGDVNEPGERLKQTCCFLIFPIYPAFAQSHVKM
jgi:hypothetical protein